MGVVLAAAAAPLGIVCAEVTGVTEVLERVEALGTAPVLAVMVGERAVRLQLRSQQVVVVVLDMGALSLFNKEPASSCKMGSVFLIT